MKLLVPSKAEVAELLSAPDTFRGYAVCAEALPPAAMLKRAIASEADTWLIPRLFCIERTHQIVGSGAFKSLPQEKSIEIGYGISPTARRQGYATEGVQLLVEEAFASGLIEEVYAEVSIANEPSQRVLKKAGFAARGITETNEGQMEIWATRKGPTTR